MIKIMWNFDRLACHNLNFAHISGVIYADSSGTWKCAQIFKHGLYPKQ